MKYPQAITSLDARSDVPAALARRMRRVRHHMNAADREAWQSWLLSNQAQIRQMFYEQLARYRKQISDAFRALPAQLPNARIGASYNFPFRFPRKLATLTLTGMDQTGLHIELDNKETSTAFISGAPQESGEFKGALVASYRGWARSLPAIKHAFRIDILPDPRELWQDLPSDKNIEYWREDQECGSLAFPDATLFGVSLRGRSHAHAGRPRDDAFGLAGYGDWKIMAVADGAGSAEFSRKGAQMACEAALRACRDKLEAPLDMENMFGMPLSANWQISAKKFAYAILAGAAFEAHKSIRNEAESKKRQAASYAATLLLAAACKCASGWFVMSFQVGDGAMAMFHGGEATLMALPDEGDYGGQTRFVTMPEIYESRELMRRVRVDLVPDLEEIIMMTDGVSDCRFPGLDAMQDQKLWQELRSEIDNRLQYEDWQAKLLEWLNFWSRGNHDDRSIAVMQVDC